MIVITVVCIALFIIDLLFLTWLRLQLNYIQVQIDDNIKDSSELLKENKRLKAEILRLSVADEAIN